MAIHHNEKAKEARLKITDMVFAAQTSHIGSNFSVVDIFVVLFDKMDFFADKIILSAGWKAAAFYYFLSKAGFFPEEDLDTYCQPESKYIGLTEPGIPGVLFAGGSMQMGMPAAVGFALSKKMKGEDGKVYCIISDGEMAGGMIWESAAIAAHHKLDNLIVIIDNNGMQAMGKTSDILGDDMESVEKKWAAFGWNPFRVDGHDYTALNFALDGVVGSRPQVIIADTIKGKGVRFMENNNLFHYKNLSEEEYHLAKFELQNG